MVLLSDRLLTRLGLRHFRLAVAVAERRSILKAASDLHISQPTATKLLQDLEHELGAPLFIRSNRGVEPNALGEAFVLHGRLLLAHAEHAAQEIADLATGAAGRVTVGTLLSASAALLPGAIVALKNQRPNVVVKVIEGANDRLLPMLRNGEADLLVGRLMAADSRDDIEQTPLYSECVTVVAGRSNPLTSAAAVSLEQLVDYQWVLPPPETTLRRQVETAFKDAGWPPPRVAVESVSLLTNRQILAHTDLLGVMPALVAEQEAASFGIAPVPVQLAFIPGAIGISTRRGTRLAPAAAALVEQLKLIAEGLVPPALGGP